MPGLGSRLSTYGPKKWSNKWRCNQHTSTDQTPIHGYLDLNQKGGRVKSGCSGALKPGKQVWLELQSQTMQRRRDWGPRCANCPRNITMVLPW